MYKYYLNFKSREEIYNKLLEEDMFLINYYGIHDIDDLSKLY